MRHSAQNSWRRWINKYRTLILISMLISIWMALVVHVLCDLLRRPCRLFQPYFVARSLVVCMFYGASFKIILTRSAFFWLNRLLFTTKFASNEFFFCMKNGDRLCGQTHIEEKNAPELKINSFRRISYSHSKGWKSHEFVRQHIQIMRNEHWTSPGESNSLLFKCRRTCERCNRLRFSFFCYFLITFNVGNWISFDGLLVIA